MLMLMFIIHLRIVRIVCPTILQPNPSPVSTWDH